LESLDPENVADVVIAAPAGGAAAADDLGRGRDFPAWPQSLDPLAHRFEYAREFMSLHDWIGGKGMAPVTDMDVGTADPNPPDPDQDLIGPGFRDGDVPELDHPGARHDGLLHASTPRPRNTASMED
jgi:hypothetical protein